MIDMLPSAHAILLFLGTFVGLWGASLIARGVFTGRRGEKRCCPVCGADLSGTDALGCGKCGYEARDERDLRRKRLNRKLFAPGVVVMLTAPVIWFAGYQVWVWTTPRGLAGSGFEMTVWLSMAAGVAAFAVIGMAWAIRGDRSRGRRRCPTCWYDMAGGGLKCPECGHESRHTHDLYRPRRRWKLAAGLSILLLVAAGLQGVPRVRAGGWRAAIPATVLIAGLPWLPDEAIWVVGTQPKENWTLLGRLEENRLWGWQRRWVAARTERILKGSSLKRLARTLALYGTVVTENKDWPQTLQDLYSRLIQQLADPQPGVRQQAAEALRVHAQSLMLQAHNVSWGVACRAAEVDRKRVMELLNDPTEDPEVVLLAASVAGCWGSEAEPVVPRLIELMETSGGMAGFAYGYPLGQLARKSAATRRRLLDLLSDPQFTRRDAVMAGLTWDSIPDPEVGEALLDCMRNGDDALARRAAVTLCRYRWNPQAVIPALLEQANSARANRGEFLQYITWYSNTDLEPHLPTVVEALKSGDPAVRKTAAEAVYGAAYAGAAFPDVQRVLAALDALRNDPDLSTANVAHRAYQIIDSAKPGAPAAEDDPPK